MITPKESGDRLMKMIREANRPVSAEEIFDFGARERLYFGPGVDVVEFLFSEKTLGIIRIDVRRGLIEFNQRNNITL